MTDIYVGIAIMIAISAGLFLIARRVALSSPRWVTNVLGALTICGMLVYVASLRDNVVMATLLPYSNLIVLGNWFPLGVGFLGGLAWIRVYGGRVRKAVYTAILLSVGLFALVHPILGEPPKCENLWAGSVCLQTSRATCSPACAATLLNSVGIEATEGEMARLCLTREGTTWQGLYRGLKLKTEGTPWTVEVFHCRVENLPAMGGPMILAVGLPRDASPHSRYVLEEGWIPGQLHSVVLLRFLDEGKVIIGEPNPNVGRELWTREDLETLWRGIGIHLVPRSTLGE